MIDWTRVATLRSEVGIESFAEVVDLFLQEADEVVSHFADVPDPGRYQMDLHFLKGSAVNLGFRDFALLCESGEKLAARGEPELISAAALVECYEVSRSRFVNGLLNREW